MDTHRGKIWKSLEILMVFIAASGMIITLYFVLFKLRFLFGVDYHMAHAWFSSYLRTGVFFPENTVFYNFPLAVAAYGPTLFLPVGPAVALKCVQTLALAALCTSLLKKMGAGFFSPDNPARYAFFVMAFSFVLAQLCYLNIYVEVAACLMAVLYFTERKMDCAAGFFLSLAVVFKVFLAPLIAVPLLTRKYRLFSWSMIFLFGLVMVSLALFGWDTHVDMIKAMSEGYGRMRLHGIGYPYVSDGFAGWQDFFNKLAVGGLMPKTMVFPLTLTLAGLYGCAFLFVCFQIFVNQGAVNADRFFFVKAFACVLVLCIGFNFRFDHGTLFLAALPWFSELKNEERKLLAASLFFMTLCRLPLETLLKSSGCDMASWFVSRFFYVVSFQFIGINLLVYLVVNHWAGQGEKMIGDARGDHD